MRNSVLAGLCVMYAWIRGKADRPMDRPRRVLVVQGAKIGDMVCTTPVFRAIKQAYPECTVWVLGDAVNRELLNYNSDVDGYIEYERGIARMIRILRKQKIDFACMTGPSPEVLAMLYLAGIPLIAAPVIQNGFSPQETKAYRMIVRLVKSVPHRMGQYAGREYLRLLESVGIYTDDTTKHLGFSDQATAGIEKFLAAHHVDSRTDLVVGLFPSTGYKIKQWPLERFARVADYLYERHGARIIVPGTKSDAGEISAMLAYMKASTPVINAVGMFGLDELKALIARMHMFVSVDTGPIYIAEALGVATVDIVGPMDEREQPSTGQRHAIVSVEREHAELHVMNTAVFDYKEAIRQRDGTTVDMVTQAIDRVILEIR